MKEERDAPKTTDARLIANGAPSDGGAFLVKTGIGNIILYAGWQMIL